MREATDRGGRRASTRNEGVHGAGPTPTSPFRIGAGAVLLGVVAFLLNGLLEDPVVVWLRDGSEFAPVTLADWIVWSGLWGALSGTLWIAVGVFVGIRAGTRRAVWQAAAGVGTAGLVVGGVLFGLGSAIDPRPWFGTVEFLVTLGEAFAVTAGAGLVTVAARPLAGELRIPDPRDLSPSPIVLGSASVGLLLVATGVAFALGNELRPAISSMAAQIAGVDPVLRGSEGSDLGLLAKLWIEMAAPSVQFGILLGVLAGVALSGRDRLTAALAGGVTYGVVTSAVVAAAERWTRRGIVGVGAEVVSSPAYPVAAGLGLTAIAVVVAYGVGTFLDRGGVASGPQGRRSHPHRNSIRRIATLAGGLFATAWITGSLGELFRAVSRGDVRPGFQTLLRFLGGFGTVGPEVIGSTVALVAGLVVVPTRPDGPGRAAVRTAAGTAAGFVPVVAASFLVETAHRLTEPTTDGKLVLFELLDANRSLPDGVVTVLLVAAVLGAVAAYVLGDPPSRRRDRP